MLDKPHWPLAVGQLPLVFGLLVFGYWPLILCRWSSVFRRLSFDIGSLVFWYLVGCLLHLAYGLLALAVGPLTWSAVE